MSPSQNRLSAVGTHHFGGTEIDRTRPLTFRLDGRDIHGFAGDTLLSAAIASGVTGAGTHDGEPLGLDERFAPPVLLRGTRDDRATALPLERTPAVGGLDLITLSHADGNRLQRWGAAVRDLLPLQRRSIGANFDDAASLTGPWFDAPSERSIEADLIVIGGGLAGLAAAQAAGKRGEQVVLIERRSWLGGEAQFFGSAGDEDSPDVEISRLLTGLVGLKNVTMLLRSEAFALFEGSVRVNAVELADGIPFSRVLTVNAPRIVLASGSIERLPVFAGNRLPGVVGAMAAFNRAQRFGVWIGRSALLATATSVAYRVAMQAKDAGIEIVRLADSRLDPQSRFVAFSKAYGIPLARGLTPRQVSQARGGHGLTVRLDHGFGEIARTADQYNVDQVVVSGGWQPDLALWHMAGGASQWRAASGRLEAEGSLNGIVLAGGVAGWRNAAACIASGRAAVAMLYGRAIPEVRDLEIDPMFETPDDATPIGAFDAKADENSYLDAGASLAQRPAPQRRRRLLRAARRPGWGFSEQARPLGVADVVAGVQLGIVPPADAAIVAQERCVTPGDIVDASRGRGVVTPAPVAALLPPPYLAGRFGARPVVWLVEPADGRSFEVGAQVYADADQADPLSAVGVVFAPPPAGRTGGLAVISRAPNAIADAKLAVRDISGAIAVRLVDPLAPVIKPIVMTPVTIVPSGPAADAPSDVAVPQTTAAPVEIASAAVALAMIAGISADAGAPAAQPAADPPPGENAAVSSD